MPQRWAAGHESSPRWPLGASQHLQKVGGGQPALGCQCVGMDCSRLVPSRGQARGKGQYAENAEQKEKEPGSLLMSLSPGTGLC